MRIDKRLRVRYILMLVGLPLNLFALYYTVKYLRHIWLALLIVNGNYWLPGI